MHKYIIKRILMLIPVILGASLLVFLLMEFAPGTVVDGMIVDGMTEAEIQAALEGLKCRCGTHMAIMRAVKRAAEMMG